MLWFLWQSSWTNTVDVRITRLRINTNVMLLFLVHLHISVLHSLSAYPIDEYSCQAAAIMISILWINQYPLLLILVWFLHFISAYPIDEYPCKCRQAAAIMMMIMNNLDPKVAQVFCLFSC